MDTYIDQDDATPNALKISLKWNILQLMVIIHIQFPKNPFAIFLSDRCNRETEGKNMTPFNFVGRSNKLVEHLVNRLLALIYIAPNMKHIPHFLMHTVSIEHKLYPSGCVEGMHSAEYYYKYRLDEDNLVMIVCNKFHKSPMKCLMSNGDTEFGMYYSRPIMSICQLIMLKVDCEILRVLFLLSAPYC